MKIQFYLARPTVKTASQKIVINTQDTGIVANIHLSGKVMRVGTGVSANPKYWNSKAHRIKISPSYPQAPEKNRRLDKIKAEIEKCYYAYVNSRGSEPSHAILRKSIDEILGRSKEVKMPFFEYFQDFMDRTDAGQRRNAKGQIIKPAKAYKVTLNNLQTFNNEWGRKLDFDTVDLDFYEDYLQFIQKKKLSENTIGREIKNLKAVLNDATERGHNTNLAYQSKRFSKPSEDVDNIALTENELYALQELDLSDSPHLDRVRDLFLIACHTGLRYSDFSRLTADNIKDGFIEVAKQEKTGRPVTIPVHPMVKGVIKKYDGSLPETISNQKFNSFLKDVCKQIEDLRKPISKTRTQGGLKTTVNYQKWEIITTHTGRRSFATNAYLQGIPSITIMAITGHKTEAAFLKYIKVSPKEHAKIMAAAWAKRSNLKVVS